MSPDTLIEIRDLKFAYDGNAVLDGVSLDIPKGKVTAVLGGSGCGKTTLLRLIGGQARPAAGHVRIGEQVVHELGDRELYRLRRKIGRMFQESGLFTDLTVYENVAFPLREHTNLPEDMIHDLVLMKLHAVGLRGASGLMPAELSGGMARRVALARAIALDPMLAIYDEPFSGLDPISLNVIANIIRTLNDTLGITSIVVTYDVSESLKIADHAYFIDAGRVVAGGPVAEVLAAKDAFVDQFVHALPKGPVAFDYPAPSLATDLRLA